MFPACERNRIDPSKPQKTWRTAWRSLVEETAKRAGDAATKAAETGGNVEEARKRAMLAFVSANGQRLRFQALAGHLCREMMEHYSHVRMAAKRAAVGGLAGGLMRPTTEEEKPASEAVN